MDLRTLRRVLWRFRLLVALGFLLAVVLAFLSYARLEYRHGSLHVKYRKAQYWQGETRLLLTQSGFPYGTADQKYATPDARGAPPVPIGDTTRLAALASLYAEFVNSDAISRSVLGPPRSYLAKVASIQASAAVPDAASGGPPLPVLTVTVVAPSPKLANVLAERATGKFLRYLRHSQAAAHISPESRVVIQILNHATKATLVGSRKKTVPIIVFLLVMILTCGLALVLENVRPAVIVASVPTRAPEAPSRSEQSQPADQVAGNKS